MTDEEMKINIALFDGWEKHPNWPGYVHNPPKHLNENGNCSIDNLRYDTSWDWLMPVVNKIYNIYSKEPYYVEEFSNVTELPITVSIKEAYEEIIKFIDWYNSQKP